MNPGRMHPRSSVLLWSVSGLVTVFFVSVAFLACSTFWVAYVNSKLPGSWLPLIMSGTAIPLSFHAWLSIIRALIRRARKTGLLEA